MKRPAQLTVAAALLATGALWFSKDSWLMKTGALKPAAATEKRAAAKTPKAEPQRDSAHALLKKLQESGEIPKLTPEELRVFVDENKHNAASLIAAWRLGSDEAWLEEATQRFPDDPKVALAKLSTLTELKEDSREWIERLKKNDPGNALGWCYDALSAFRGGDPEKARDALAEASRRNQFGPSFQEAAKDAAAAYQSAGYDGLGSEVMGMASMPLPQATLALNLVKEAIAALGPDPDDASIQDMLAITRAVRGHGDTAPLIMTLVAASMERKTLDQLNALELIPGTRQFVLERLDELNQERNSVKEVIGKATPLLSNLAESEMRQYLRRTTVEGELKAMQWLIGRHPEVK